VCFSCCRKADNELADVTLSGRLFQNCAAATGNARPPMVDSLIGGIRKSYAPGPPIAAVKQDLTMYIKSVDVV